MIQRPVDRGYSQKLISTLLNRTIHDQFWVAIYNRRKIIQNDAVMRAGCLLPLLSIDILYTVMLDNTTRWCMTVEAPGENSHLPLVATLIFYLKLPSLSVMNGCVRFVCTNSRFRFVRYRTILPIVRAIEWEATFVHIRQVAHVYLMLFLATRALELAVPLED